MSDELTAEIVVDIPENLALAVKSTGLDTQAAEVIEAHFAPLFVQANKWAAQVAGLKVTDVSQVREMKLARESRLALKEIRVLAGKNKDRLKEDSLKRSRAVDSIYNTVKAICEPLEAELLAQEQFALRAEVARLEKVKAERVSQLTQYGVDCAFYQLDVMPAEQFEQLLAGSKAAHEARLEAERKAEADRLAAIAAEEAERARIAAENERLKREAIEREKAAQAERERVAAAELKAKQEREELEAAMRKQKEEAEAAAKAAADSAAEEARKIKAESDRLAKIAADKAKAERDAIEAKARKEREEAQAKAEAERAELRRQAQDAADALAKAEAETKAIRDAEAAKAAAEEAARKKAERAPDRDKVLAFAEFIRAIPAPQLTTDEGRIVQSAIAGQIIGFADWIAKKGGAL